MYKPESVHEKKTRKVHRDYELKKVYLISTREPELVIINKRKERKNCWIVDFAVPADNKVNLKESQKRDNYQDLATQPKNYGTWKC